MSYFFYALEGMLDNEIRGLTLIDRKMGLTIAIPGVEVLRTFGFRTLHFIYDALALYGLWVSFAALAWFALLTLVREQR